MRVKLKNSRISNREEQDFCACGLLGRLDRRLMCTGAVLLLMGIALPSVLTVHSVRIYETLREGLVRWEKIYVLLAALKLVSLNTIRAIPHYLGAFFLAEAINETREKRWTPMSMLVIFITIPGVYFIIEKLYGIRYDLGMPAVSMIAMMLLFSKIRFDFVNTAKKVMMMVLLIIAIQFLDVMPLLRGLPFGRGESSFDIKMASQVLGADVFLQGMAMICAVLFFVMALMLVVLIHDENNIKRISEQKEQSERALMENQMRILENRTYMELNHLVHDLKSPLTSMQTLVGVVKLGSECRGETRDVAYLEKIEDNIERMSSMISEILYEDRFTRTTTRKVVKGVLAQISTAQYAEMIQVDNQVPDVYIEVNMIRFSRALINLLENSFYAINQDTGIIWFRVTEAEMSGTRGVLFEVQDNGIGMPEETLGQVLVNGFSTRGSNGLGLSFVEKVVTKSGGFIRIESVRNQGTSVKAFLPACSETREEEGAAANKGQLELKRRNSGMSDKNMKVLKGVITSQEMNCFDVVVCPDGDSQVLMCAPEGMEQKRFDRQCSVLVGHVCLALGGAPKADQAVDLERLALPQEENQLTKAAVWFSRACQSEDPHTVTIAVYNGLGALPGGYPQVEELAQQYMGGAAKQFMDCVRAAKWNEDDSGDSEPAPGVEVWKGADLNLMRKALLEACRAVK